MRLEKHPESGNVIPGITYKERRWGLTFAEMISPFFIPLAYLLWKIQSCFAVSSNRTIDDFYGDPITGFIPLYEPLNAWHAVAVGILLAGESLSADEIIQNGNCSTCFVHVDPTQTSNDTWHDSTQKNNSAPSSVTIQFTGKLAQYVTT
jgi:hypothetical protein